jgi:tRNA dimethylallyltransferase
LEEVDALRNRNIPQDRPLMRAVGVPELIGYLNGAHSLAEAEEQAQIATRRYAKRQITWLKSNFISDVVFNLKYSKRLMRDIFSFIEENRLIPE